MKTNPTIQHVDTCDEDRALVRHLEDRVHHLAGLVVEAFETNPLVLLSPQLRGVIAERAEEVAALLARVEGRLVVDNPGREPL